LPLAVLIRCSFSRGAALPAAGHSDAAGAMEQRLPEGVGVLAVPDPERRLLERAAEREARRPRSHSA